jgi:hypothetical protein
VIGWKLDRSQRQQLLAEIEPRYENVVADHVTLAANIAADAPLPDRVPARAVGHVDDGRGVQALVVEVAGSTDRFDGGTYHITWSLGPGRQARESNDVLASQAWGPLDEVFDLILEPARWP